MAGAGGRDVISGRSHGVDKGFPWYGISGDCGGGVLEAVEVIPGNICLTYGENGHILMVKETLSLLFARLPKAAERRLL